MRDWTGNKKSVEGLLGIRSKESRETNDYYATDPRAAEMLLNLEVLSNRIWEPSCGEGHISKVFESHGKEVMSTDLIDRGYGRGGVDFLKCNEKFDGDIVTNPPYKYAVQFVENANRLITEGHKVCMFLKLQFCEGIEHRKLFELYPPVRIWVSTRRIECGKNGVFTGDKCMMCFAWFVWMKGWRGCTELKWFNN